MSVNWNELHSKLWKIFESCKWILFIISGDSKVCNCGDISDMNHLHIIGHQEFRKGSINAW